jgi:hypothetical protein
MNSNRKVMISTTGGVVTRPKLGLSSTALASAALDSAVAKLPKRKKR